MLIRAHLGLAALMLAGGSIALAATAVQTDPAPVAGNAALQVKSVTNATLGAIAQTPKDAKVEDFEGAILFAIDNLQLTSDIIDQGLAEAEATVPDGAAKTAIQNIRRMKRRLAGTGAIPSGTSSLYSGPSLGGGGGGTANYGN